MPYRTNARAALNDFSRLALRELHELLDGVSGERRKRSQNGRLAGDEYHGREIAQRMVRQPAGRGFVNGKGDVRRDQRVAVAR